jgi:hypothetical protein
MTLELIISKEQTQDLMNSIMRFRVFFFLLKLRNEGIDRDL